MKRTIRLTESRPTEVAISSQEAQAITGLGKALVSKATWWGDEPDEASRSTRSLITCNPTTRNTWFVTVSNAIGAFGIGDLTCLVTPKIPMQHALYVLSMSSLLPRLDDSKAHLAKGSEFWELLAEWFLSQAEKVVESDLIRDYQSSYDLLTSLRGQLDSIPTADKYYSGSLDMVCTYDDFTVDNSLNRVILAGLNALEGLTQLRKDLRRRARHMTSYFIDVGQLLSSDMGVNTDRRSSHYVDALTLAKLIITATAFDLSEGNGEAWTFLIRTPEAIEQGIRALLASGLAPRTTVRKYGTALRPSNLQVRPDLRFEPTGFVGDIKYKAFGADWPRSDLYQSVAFAAGCGTKRSCVISFDVGDGNELPKAWFHNTEVTSIVWDAREETSPSTAAARLIEDCKLWLQDGPAESYNGTGADDALVSA